MNRQLTRPIRPQRLTCHGCLSGVWKPSREKRPPARTQGVQPPERDNIQPGQGPPPCIYRPPPNVSGTGLAFRARRIGQEATRRAKTIDIGRQKGRVRSCVAISCRPRDCERRRANCQRPTLIRAIDLRLLQAIGIINVDRLPLAIEVDCA